MATKLSSALIAEFVGTFALIFIGAGAGAMGVGGLVGVAFAHGLVIVAFRLRLRAHLRHPHQPRGHHRTVGRRPDRGRARAWPTSWSSSWAASRSDDAARRARRRRERTGPRRPPCWPRPLPVGGSIITITPAAGLLIETILTFFLVNTIFNAAVSGKAGGHAGLAIGMTLTFCILMGGPLTGASLNPARTIGPAVVTGNYADLWVYIVGPIAGGVIAALLYRGALAPEK